MEANGDALDWVEVKDNFTSKMIGAVGFIGNKAAVVVAYYDDLDWDNDGKVGGFEFVASKTPVISNLFFKTGRQLTSVYMQALGDPDIVMRDETFQRDAVQQFMNFAKGLVFDGVYLVYFSKGVGSASAGIAKAVTESTVKQYLIRKGMEKAVKATYDKAVEFGIHK